MIHVAHFIAISCYAATGDGYGLGIIDAARYLFALESGAPGEPPAATHAKQPARERA